MCLATPGLILAISGSPGAAGPSAGPATATDTGPDADLWRQAEVDFGGVRQWVSLACLPEATVGDRVLVHVGIALSIVQDEP